MGVKIKNNAFGVLLISINTSATSITLQTGQGANFPALSAGDYFYATLIDTSNNLEIVKVTARTGDVLTVTRAQEGTTARSYAVGDRIELRLTAQNITDLLTENLAASLAAVIPSVISDEENTSTGYFALPKGTTAQRPGSPAAGMVRMNTTTGTPEWYDTAISTWTPFHTRAYIAEVLIVGGGGSGAGSTSGGGGAGGLLYYGSETPKTPNGAALSIESGSTIPIVIGAGGSAVGTQTVGNNGADTTVGLPSGTLTAFGGGRGAGSSSGAQLLGSTGGSGGGGGGYVGGGGIVNGGNGYAGTVGQGNAGGNYNNDNAPGGGGGGSGGVGGNATTTTGGAGGVGLAYSISGSSTFYAAGGGGGATAAGGTGGSGIGGNGATATGATNAVANRGSGGGGGYNYSGGAGGAGSGGIVIIRYAGSQRATGGTVTSSGGYTIHTFTSSGTFVA